MEQPAEQPVIVTLVALHENTLSIIETMHKSGQPVIVTRHGRPLAVMKPLGDDFFAKVLSEAAKRGDFDLGELGQGTPLEEALNELHSTEEVARELGIER